MKTLTLRSVVAACLLLALLWTPALTVHAGDGSPAGFIAQWTGWWNAWTAWWTPETDSTPEATPSQRQNIHAAGEAETVVPVGFPTAPETQESYEEDSDRGSGIDPYG